MKIDKVGDMIEVTKEEKLKQNMQQLDKSLNMIEEFKKFNKDLDSTSEFLSK